MRAARVVIVLLSTKYESYVVPALSEARAVQDANVRSEVQSSPAPGNPASNSTCRSQNSELSTTATSATWMAGKHHADQGLREVPVTSNEGHEGGPRFESRLPFSHVQLAQRIRLKRPYGSRPLTPAPESAACHP
jgi:hypothetical protein